MVGVSACEMVSDVVGVTFCVARRRRPSALKACSASRSELSFPDNSQMSKLFKPVEPSDSDELMIVWDPRGRFSFGALPVWRKAL
jgi:hypothetical protein